MTTIIQISIPDNYDYRGIVKRIAKRVKLESDIGKKSSIMRDALKLLEKYLYPDTVFIPEGIYVNNDGLIELKESINKGNNPNTSNHQVIGVLLGIRDFLEELSNIDIEKFKQINFNDLKENAIKFHLKKIEITLGELK